jgi:hypothetical protein
MTTDTIAKWPTFTPTWELLCVAAHAHPESWFDTDQAAAFLGVKRSWLLNSVAGQSIPHRLDVSRKVLKSGQRKGSREPGRANYYPVSELTKLKTFWSQWNSEDLLGAQEAASLLAVSLRQLRRYEAAGKMPRRVAVRHELYYLRSDLEAKP